MTIGMLLESMAGKAGAMALAKCLAATPKSPEDEATLEEGRKLKL